LWVLAQEVAYDNQKKQNTSTGIKTHMEASLKQFKHHNLVHEIPFESKFLTT
jgi:hypothetical protein